MLPQVRHQKSVIGFVRAGERRNIMNKHSAGRALPTMLQVLPPVARDLAFELETELGNGGARTRLKLGAALAAAAALRDDELWRSLVTDASGHGEADIAPLALQAAMRFAHAGSDASSDATTRILRLALLRALHGHITPDAQPGVDPLVDECAVVVEIVHALAIARAVDRTAEDIERVASFLRLGKRQESSPVAADPRRSTPPRIEDAKASTVSPASPRLDPEIPRDRRFESPTPPGVDARSDRPPASVRGAGASSSKPPGELRRSDAPNGSPRVLVIDDDESYRKLLDRMLSPLDVVHAASGAAALETLAADGDFEVILSKVDLPEVSGAQILDTIKKKWPHLASRVVFVATTGTAPEGQTLLRKPINRDSLLKTIARVSKAIADMHGQEIQAPRRS